MYIVNGSIVNEIEWELKDMHWYRGYGDKNCLNRSKRCKKKKEWYNSCENVVGLINRFSLDDVMHMLR